MVSLSDRPQTAHTNPCSLSKCTSREFRPLWAARNAHRGRERQSQAAKRICAHWAKPGGTTESQIHPPVARPWRTRGSGRLRLATPSTAEVEVVGQSLRARVRGRDLRHDAPGCRTQIPGMCASSARPQSPRRWARLCGACAVAASLAHVTRLPRGPT